MLMSQPI